MATLREVTALALLYQACGDPTLRRRVAALVPELDELTVAVAPRLTVVDGSARAASLRIMDYCASRPTVDWSVAKIAELVAGSG